MDETNRDQAVPYEVTQLVSLSETEQTIARERAVEVGSCSKSCKAHWPLRFASISVIACALGFYGILEFAPSVANYLPSSGSGADRTATMLADQRNSEPPDVDMALPVEEFKGTTACAQCEHNVSPIHHARTKGLALVLGDGRVAVVENAHNFYPDAYRIRENHLPATLTGRVVKSENNVIWVHPVSFEIDQAVVAKSQ